VTVVSRRDLASVEAVASIEQVLAREGQDYAVVANETGSHLDAVERLASAGYEGKLLVEKPVFRSVADFPANRFAAAFVAYNLRFHPLLERLHALLQEEEAVTASIYVGQYLPDWRPGTDYRQSYSARGEAGGGVLRDLSHDLDYACWLFGAWQRVTALGGHLSELDIASEDAFALLVEAERCPVVTVQMSYLDRNPRRQIVVNTRRRTFFVDLVANRMLIDGEQQDVRLERDSTYRAMHEAIFWDDGAQACRVDEALEVLRLIDAAHTAAERQSWVFA